MSAEKTISLIEQLTGELKPIRTLLRPRVRFMLWAGVTALYIAACAAFLGLRMDIGAQTQALSFQLEIGLIGALAIIAGLCSFQLCVPGRGQQRWVSPAALTLLAVFIIWSFARMMIEGLHFDLPHWNSCFEDAMLMGAVPAAFLMFLTLRGATTRPRMLALFNGLSVGAAGYVGLRLICPIDTVGHAGLYHLFPFIVFGLGLGALARRVFRW